MYNTNKTGFYFSVSVSYDDVILKLELHSLVNAMMSKIS